MSSRRRANELIAALERCFGARSLPHHAKADFQRSQYIGALVAVADFLDGSGRPDLSVKFAELAETLDDLERGALNPILQGRTVKRRPDISAITRARAAVCVCVEVLLACGSRQYAIQHLSTKYSTLLQSILSAKSRNSDVKIANTIASWESQFSSEKTLHPRAVATFDKGRHFQKLVKAAPIASREQLAHRLVKVLLKDASVFDADLIPKRMGDHS